MRGQAQLLLLVLAVEVFVSVHISDAACTAFDMGSEDGLPCQPVTPHPKSASQAVASSSTKGADKQVAFTSTAYIGFGGQQLSIHGQAEGILNLFSESQHQLNARFDVADQLLSPDNVIKQMGFSYSDGDDGVASISISVLEDGQIKVSNEGNDILGDGIIEEGIYQGGDMKILPGCVEEDESHCDGKIHDFESVTIDTPMLRLWIWGEPPSSSEQRQSALNFKLTLMRAPRTRVGGLLGISLPSILTKRNVPKNAKRTSQDAGEDAFSVSSLYGDDYPGNQFRLGEDAAPKKLILKRMVTDDSLEWPIGRKLAEVAVFQPARSFGRKLLSESALEEAINARLPISASAITQRHLTAVDLQIDHHDDEDDDGYDFEFPTQNNKDFANWSRARSVETTTATSAIWGGSFSGRILTAFSAGSRLEAAAASMLA